MAIDILSVTVILFGVVTTLERGSLQINSGLKELFDIPYSQGVQSLIICIITFVATLSFTDISLLERSCLKKGRKKKVKI